MRKHNFDNLLKDELLRNRFAIQAIYSSIAERVIFKEVEFMGQSIVACKIQYRIFSDALNYHDHLILVSAHDFEVISGIAPKNWILNRYEGFGSVLGPEMWNIYEPWEESFWQDFDNNLPKARECFDNELKIIFATDPEYVKIIDQQQGREPYFK